MAISPIEGSFANDRNYYPEREAIKIQCHATGNDACTFLVGGDKQLNTAEFWLRAGASAQEIVGSFE